MYRISVILSLYNHREKTKSGLFFWNTRYNKVQFEINIISMEERCKSTFLEETPLF